MNDQKNYLNQIEKKMNGYKQKIEKFDSFLENYESDKKKDLLTQKDNLQDKFAEAEKMVEKMKYSTKEEYEMLKEKAGEVFDAIKQAFNGFSTALTFDKFAHAKDELLDFGAEKWDDAQDIVKKHPIAAAASALTVGFVMGKLLTRSK